MNKDKKYFWTSETQMYYDREKIVKCKNAYIFDENGKKYIDLNSGTWNTILGYGRDEFDIRFINQINNVQYIPNLRFYHEQGDKLAKRILNIVGSYYSSVFFTSGGAESVETSIKIAKQYWYNKGYKNKNRIISLYESYHGSTLGAMSVSGDPWDRIPYDGILQDTLKIYPFYCYKCRLGLNNNICNSACLKDLEYQINFYGSENISSLIIEPIMGVGGVIVPSKEWLNSLVELCHKYNIIVIFDEITSGFGRCGNYFSFLDYDIKPDLISFGKCVSNGVVSLAGTIISKDIYSAFRDKSSENQFRHGYTNSGHPLACLAGNIVLDIFEKENIIKKISEKSIEFSLLLESLKKKPYIGEIRIKGLMIAIELINPITNSDLIIPNLAYKFKENGIIMSHMTQVVCFMPSICVSKEDFSYGIEMLKKIIEDYLIVEKDDIIKLKSDING